MNLMNISKSSSVFPQGGFLPIPYPNQHLRVLLVVACGTIRLYYLILQYAAFTILPTLHFSGRGNCAPREVSSLGIVSSHCLFMC